MKNLICSLLAVSVVIFSTLPTIALEKINGAYKGIIWSNGDNPGETIFSISSSNKITGKYVFEGLNSVETGVLKNCKLDTQTLNCTWADSYGTGDFHVKFSSDFKTFSGAWFDNEGDYKTYGLSEGHTWNGKK